MKKSLLYILCIFLLIAPALEAFAGSVREDASDFLVKVGKRSLEGGDLQTALHEFSKALMLNPDNKQAKFYLKQFNIDKDSYTDVTTRASQMSDLARDLSDYKEQYARLKAERFHLQKRVDLLEDAIERKGDHKLLKDIEDYYRQSAFYDVDERLPPNRQLRALREKHKAFKRHVFDKDRLQDKSVDVMEELLEYREEHLEEARNDLVEYKIALAQNRKELLHRMDHLKRLSDEFDAYRQKRYYDTKELEWLRNEMDEAQKQIDLLIKERGAVIQHINDELKEIKQSL